MLVMYVDRSFWFQIGSATLTAQGCGLAQSMTLQSFGPITRWATQLLLTSFLHHASAKNATLYMRLCWWDFVLTGEFSAVLLGHRGSACQSSLLVLIYRPPGSTTGLQWPMIIMIIIMVSQGLVSPLKICDITVACGVFHTVVRLRKEMTRRVPSHTDWDNPSIFPNDSSGVKLFLFRCVLYLFTYLFPLSVWP